MLKQRVGYNACLHVVNSMLPCSEVGPSLLAVCHFCPPSTLYGRLSPCIVILQG